MNKLSLSGRMCEWMGGCGGEKVCKWEKNLRCQKGKGIPNWECGCTLQRVSVPAHPYLRSDVYSGVMLELGKVRKNVSHEMSPCTRQTKPGGIMFRHDSVDERHVSIDDGCSFLHLFLLIWLKKIPIIKKKFNHVTAFAPITK